METLFDKWYWRHYGHILTDREIEPFLQLQISGPWLKKAREASFLSIEKVSSRLGISWAAYRRIELREVKGAIHLATLATCAAAMDCELVYAIRPKSHRPFSHGVWRILEQAAKGPSIFHICMRMYDMSFRLKQGWGRDHSPQALEYTQVLKANRDLSLRPP